MSLSQSLVNECFDLSHPWFKTKFILNLIPSPNVCSQKCNEGQAKSPKCRIFGWCLAMDLFEQNYIKYFWAAFSSIVIIGTSCFNWGKDDLCLENGVRFREKQEEVWLGNLLEGRMMIIFLALCLSVSQCFCSKGYSTTSKPDTPPRTRSCWLASFVSLIRVLRTKFGRSARLEEHTDNQTDINSK